MVLGFTDILETSFQVILWIQSEKNRLGNKNILSIVEIMCVRLSGFKRRSVRERSDDDVAAVK